jgi:hypothetical protein
MLAMMGLLIDPVDAAPRDTGPGPDTDFLEFLGSWQTDDHKWIDPFHEDDPSMFETRELEKKRSENSPPAVQRKPLNQDPRTNEWSPASRSPRKDATP